MFSKYLPIAFIFTFFVTILALQVKTVLAQEASFNPITSPITVPITVPEFSNLRGQLTGKFAAFGFEYSGFSRLFRVDMGKKENMLVEGYANFGVGTQSPIIVSYPQDKWSGYRCGETIYWRVTNADRSVKSPIKKDTVVCN